MVKLVLIVNKKKIYTYGLKNPIKMKTSKFNGQINSIKSFLLNPQTDQHQQYQIIKIFHHNKITKLKIVFVKLLISSTKSNIPKSHQSVTKNHRQILFHKLHTLSKNFLKIYINLILSIAWPLLRKKKVSFKVYFEIQLLLSSIFNSHFSRFFFIEGEIKV